MARLRRIGIAIKCEDVSRRIAPDDSDVVSDGGRASRATPASEAQKGLPAGYSTSSSLTRPSPGISSASNH